MHVRVISFGILKDWLGSEAASVELEDGATVADLMRRLVSDPIRGNRFDLQIAGIAVGVNAEYATSSRVLCDGDEVALLPPVSGGSPAQAANISEQIAHQQTITLTRDRIDTEKLVADTRAAEDGAIVVFDGIVRNNSRGRATLYLDYEAYEEMALAQMRQLAAEAKEKFGVRQVVMVHRLGRLEIGDTSVLIVVASAHRAQAFDASRWLIDTLKRTVPIWKKETFTDGAVWAPGEPFPAELQIPAPGAKYEE